MTDSVELGKKWGISQESWDTFLVHLDTDTAQAGQKYERLRVRLTTFFRCRGFFDPEGLADETINRTIKGLEREEIRDITAYAIGVARYVASETHKKPTSISLETVQELRSVTSGDDSSERRFSTQLECVEECGGILSEADRELVFSWYRFDKSQKADEKRKLALSFGIEVGALRVRAFRARERIRKCVFDCLARQSVTKSEIYH